MFNAQSTRGGRRRRLIYLFTEGVAYRLVNRTGSPRGFSRVQSLHKSQNVKNIYNACTYTLYKRKTYKHNPKVSPFGSALLRKTPRKATKEEKEEEEAAEEEECIYFLKAYSPVNRTG